MSAPGGSAALNGFLFQILANLHWITAVRFQDTIIKHEDLLSVRMELEPSEGGGDTRYHLGSKRIIEQYKTRSVERTWSVFEIINEVMKDLFKAVPDEVANDNSIYRFVTNGREGRLAHFRDILHIARDNPFPACDPFNLLDCMKKRTFFRNKRHTQVELFEYIVSAVSFGEKNLLEQRHRVWHLLSHFEIHSQQNPENYKREIDQFLKTIINYEEDATTKRHELCSILFEHASNNASVTIDHLLQEAKIDKVPLINLSALNLTLREQVNVWCNSREYSADLDVRSAPQWPSEKPILIIASDSGQGKTWQLAKLAQQVCQSGDIAVIISSRQNADQDCNRLSEVVYQQGFGRDVSIPLHRLASKMREHVPALPPQWLTACIDDIQTSEQANQIVRESWEEWGIRLVITTSKRIGRNLHAMLPSKIELVQLGDFTFRETSEYLRRCGLDWGEIPQDIRDTLRTPVLAGIYSRLSRKGMWTPKTEYELYKQYWDQISVKPGQDEYPGDREALLRLSGTLLKGDIAYPWTPDTYSKGNINDERLVRLEKTGSIRIHERGEIEVWHDRLLNWSVAEYLIDQRRRGFMNVSELGQIFTQMLYTNELFSGKNLGYVPMDYLWIASGSQNETENDVLDILNVLDSTEQPSHLRRKLLALLPSLGTRIVPYLIQHLEEKADDEIDSWTNTQLLNEIGKQAPKEISEYAIYLIRTGKLPLTKIGFNLLREYPNSDYLDEIWDHHIESFRNLNLPKNERPNDAYWQHDMTWKALRNAARLAPDWIENKIKKIDPNIEPVSEIGWLINNIQHSEGEKIWRNNKKWLLNKTPERKRRVLAMSIGKFRDYEEIDIIKAWCIASEASDFLNAAAFSSLCRMDASAALELVENMNEMSLTFSRGWWIKELYFREPDRLNKVIMERVRKEDKGLEFFTQIYSGYENYVSDEGLNYFLDEFEVEIKHHFNADNNGEIFWLYYRFNFIEKIKKPPLLKILNERSGSDLDIMLGKILSERFHGERGDLDNILKNARDVLRKIAGEGITLLANSELESDVKVDRSDGIADSMVFPNKLTRDLLGKIADIESTPIKPNDYNEKAFALYALSSIGEHKAVKSGVLKMGTYCSPSLIQVWRPGNELNPQEIRQYISNAFENGNEEQLNNALILAQCSSSPELIPDIKTLISSISLISHTAYLLTQTLLKLGDKGDAFILFLTRMLKIKGNNRGLALRVLFKIDTPATLDSLITHFQDLKYPDVEEADWDVAISLFREKGLRSQIEPVLKKWIIHKREEFTFYSKYLEILPELDISNTHDVLLSEAFNTETTTPMRVIHAIRGLYQIDPESAFNAAKRAIHRLSIYKEFLPNMLVKLNPDEAMEFLTSLPEYELSAEVRWAIGKALRKIDPEKLIMKIKKMLLQEANEIRLHAINIAGWQHPGFIKEELVTIATNDSDREVSEAALEALNNQERQVWVIELIENITTIPDPQKWGWIKAITDLGDPHLLWDADDPIWENRSLDHIPPHIGLYFEELLKYQEREIKKRAADIDRKRVNLQ